jgi:hypothetical protein
MNTKPKTVLTALATLAMLAAGCHHDTDTATTKYDGMRFTEDGESTSIGRLAEAQAAAGAKADATLHDNGFDGCLLNSLGQGKLDLLVKGTTPGQPVEVWLAMPHDVMTARQPAVAAYLRNHGVPETLVAINEGPNPNTSVAAAATMGAVYKADANGYNGTPADMPGSTGGGGISGGAAH